MSSEPLPSSVPIRSSEPFSTESKNIAFARRGTTVITGTRPDDEPGRHLQNRVTAESVPDYSKFSCGTARRAYNETAFRHFLAIERRRAERSMRPLLLVLATLRPRPGREATLTDETSAALFDGLGASIREVDFAGWFRDGRVAGAVLAQGGQPSEAAQYFLSQRVSRALQSRLPAD